MENKLPIIKDLENILYATKTEIVETGGWYPYGSGDGHSFNDKPDWVQGPDMPVTTYVYSKKEREKALKDLKKIRKLQLNPLEKKSVEDIFEKLNQEKKKARIKTIPKIIQGAIVTGILAAGLAGSVYLIKNHIYNKKLEKGKDSISLIKHEQENLNSHYTDYLKARIEYLKDSARKRVETGEIIINQKEYQTYLAPVSNSNYKKK